MEIEGTTHYTLRHIYAARLVLFGAVDLVILTGFCGALTLALQLSLATLVTQFLLPLVTTACLCFAVLSSPRAAQGTVATAPVSSGAACGGSSSQTTAFTARSRCRSGSCSLR